MHIDVKQLFLTQSRIAVNLLTGRWPDEPWSTPGSFAFYGLGAAYLLTAAVKRIVGVADAGPLSALVVPLLWLGLVYLAGVYKNRPEFLSAFMHMAVAVNLVAVFSIAVGLDQRIYQWALEAWLYGATVYVFHKLASGPASEPTSPAAAVVEPVKTVVPDWQHGRWERPPARGEE